MAGDHALCEMIVKHKNTTVRDSACFTFNYRMYTKVGIT